jgi:hypothetical protein
MHLEFERRGDGRGWNFWWTHRDGGPASSRLVAATFDEAWSAFAQLMGWRMPSPKPERALVNAAGRLTGHIVER